MNDIGIAEPRRACQWRSPATGRVCDAHVLKRRDRFYCPVCGEMRSLGTTLPVDGPGTVVDTILGSRNPTSTTPSKETPCDT